jgi:hypothetical protein
MKRRRDLKKEEKQKELNFVGNTAIEDDEDTEVSKLNTLTADELAISPLFKEGEVEVEIEKVKIILPLPVYYKLMTYTKLVDDEINGLGMVERVGACFRITEIYLLKQKVSKSSCEIDQNSIVELMTKIADEKKNPSNIRLWWHSHNTMGTFWSKTDEDTGKQFAGQEYLVSIVTTHSGEMRARINLYAPIELALDNVSIVIEHDKPAESMIEECKKEVEAKVNREVYKYVGYGYHTEYKGYNEPKDKERVNLDGPWGNVFIDKGIRFVWNGQKQMYLGYDVKTGKELSQEEILKRVDIDYNGFIERDSVYDDDWHLRQGYDY